MKNKFFALLIFSATLFGLLLYFSDFFLWKTWRETLESVTRSGSIIQKPVQLEKIDTKKRILNTSETREDEDYYKVIQIDDKKFYFSVKNIGLVLLNRQKKEIATVWLYKKNDLKIQKVYSVNDSYLLITPEKKYIFSESLGFLESFQLDIAINYIKENINFYIIHTEKWVFLYDKKTKKLEYFHMFGDVVFYDEKSYVWVLEKNDTKRASNLWVTLDSRDLILYYNPFTKEKSIVLQSEVSIAKIYKQWASIYVENTVWEVFRLKHFKK